MIVVRLMGGLGNQMFQYAAARRLAIARKTQLRIDASWYELENQGAAPREYELECFSLNPRFISPNRYVFVDKDEKKSLKRHVFLHTKAAAKAKLHPYRETSPKFHKEVLWLPNNTYLDGYWQCEDYFVGSRDAVLKDFSFKEAPQGKNKALLDQIKTTNAISIHVRRGDYANVKLFNQFHGLTEMDYYKKAIDHMAKKVENPHFYVFSDEPEWCKKNLTFNYEKTYVSHNKKGADDLRLMSNCKHHIVANSSFSWWGAWLNPSGKKIVIAPKVWFKDPVANRENNIVPKDWIRL